MRRTNTIIIMLLVSTVCYSQSEASSKWQKPPVLPIVLSWGQEGLNIHAERTIAAAASIPFDLEISGELEKLSSDEIHVSESDFNTPVFIELDSYFSELDANKVKGERAAEKPRIKIDRDGRKRKDMSEEKVFTLELRNFEGNKTQEFIVNGIDVFLIETEGNTKIEAYQKKIVIDVADSGVKEIMFRGGRLLKSNFVEKVPSLCQQYNDKFQEQAAFTVEDTLLSPMSRWKLEHVRDLITKYNITDFRDEPLAYLGNLFITKNGIGFRVRTGTFKKNGGWTKYSKDHNYMFFPWAKFINLEFDKYYNDRQLKIVAPYSDNYIYEGNPNFSNVEMIQFLKELNHLVSTSIK